MIYNTLCYTICILGIISGLITIVLNIRDMINKSKKWKTYHTDDGLKCEDTYLTNMFEDYFSSSNDFEVFLVDGDKSISDEEIKKRDISDEEIKKRDIEVYAKW